MNPRRSKALPMLAAMGLLGAEFRRVAEDAGYDGLSPISRAASRTKPAPWRDPARDAENALRARQHETRAAKRKAAKADRRRNR